MARLRKCPVTSYLLVALFPLVPGGGICYTMEHALNGDTELFLDTLMHTLGLAARWRGGRAAGGLRSPPVHHLPVPPPGLREERYHARYEVVLFDADHTLFDFDRAEAWGAPPPDAGGRRDCPPTGRPSATYPSTGRSGTGWTGVRCAGSGWW